MKPFEIFRAGRHTPMKGDAVSFTEADLAAIAAAYDPAKHHAPIVVGHPKTDAPAYGWVEKVEVQGDRLVATPADVNAEFADLVREKKFRKVSVSFYGANSPGNPTPGSVALRHVGFLGAQPPAVKGLKEIEFSEEDDTLTLEFADWTVSSVASSSSRLFRRIRDWFVQERGIETADELLPEWEIENLTRSAIEAQADPVRFSEPSLERNPMTTTPTAPDAAELERRAAALAANELAFAERQAKARATEDAAFVAGLVEKGTVPKALQATAVALFAELDEETLEFGEGDDATSTTPRAAFQDFLKRLPAPVATGEIAGGGDEAIDFSDPAETAGHIRKEQAAARAEGQDISSAQALDRLKMRASA